MAHRSTRRVYLSKTVARDTYSETRHVYITHTYNYNDLMTGVVYKEIKRF